MKHISWIMIIMIAMVSAAIVACNSDTKSVTEIQISQDSLVKRGSYLVNAIGCDD